MPVEAIAIQRLEKVEQSIEVLRWHQHQIPGNKQYSRYTGGVDDMEGRMGAKHGFLSAYA